MQVENTPLSGFVTLTPQIYGDERGFFMESYNASVFAEAGISCQFVQDNHSRSCRGTLRGLHYQSSPGQAKLLRVVQGAIFDVAVDIRPESDTFGQWHGVELSAENAKQAFVPVGFAHGFCVLSETADVLYKVSALYDPKTECGFRWDDPDVGVDWPVKAPLLSERDQSAESFAELKARLLAGRISAA